MPPTDDEEDEDCNYNEDERDNSFKCDTNHKPRTNRWSSSSGSGNSAYLDHQHAVSSNKQQQQGQRASSPKHKAVKFNHDPIIISSTHAIEDYDRRNNDVNPVTASAEYELEKPMEQEGGTLSDQDGYDHESQIRPMQEAQYTF